MDKTETPVTNVKRKNVNGYSEKRKEMHFLINIQVLEQGQMKCIKFKVDKKMKNKTYFNINILQ